MSYDVSAFGKLKRVDLNGLSIEEKCKEICTTLIPKVEIYKFQTTYKSWLQCLRDNFYDKYIITKDGVYEIIESNLIDGSDYFCNISPSSEEGEFIFAAHFYNGGTCLEECLEEELSKLNN